MKRIGLLILLTLMTALTLRAQVSGVTAELQLGQDQYLPDEDLQLRLKVINRSGQDLVLGTYDDWIIFSVQGQDNFVCPKRGEMPVKGEFTLKSGEVGTRALNPTPYFDFTRPGRYRLAARIRVPQWNQEIVCKPVTFTVSSGVPLPDFANLQFGMPLPAGISNVPPEVRRYSLLKVSYVDELMLYFRLTDANGRTLRVFPIAKMTSFSEPEAQIDRFNNLHVLHQTGARAFNYSVINPEGTVLVRQRHEYTTTRPELRIDADGRVFVAGGLRRLTQNDLPTSR